MKELKVDIYKHNPNLISFEAIFFQSTYTFIKIRNFETKTIITAFKKYYICLNDNLNLGDNLDLKYFKMEIL